jgi:hypothetical protein
MASLFVRLCLHLPSTSGCSWLQAPDSTYRTPRVDYLGGNLKAACSGLRGAGRSREACLAGEVYEGEKDASLHRSCKEDSRKGQEAEKGEVEDGVRRASRYVAQEIRRPTIRMKLGPDWAGS